MADYITPEEVPSTGTLENIIGFDASNKWVKTPGNTFAKAANLAETDNKITAAQNAAETAQESATVAQSAAETAQTAATQAVAKANTAINNTTKLWGLLKEIYVVELNESQDYSVSALWFCNGLTDPTSHTPPTTIAASYNTVLCTPNDDAKLRFMAVNKIPSGWIAELTCVFVGGKLTIYSGNTELGYFTRLETDGNPNTSDAFAYSLKIIERSGFYITDMANCTFTKTYTGLNYTILVSSSGRNSITVDDALSTTSKNPVQNKVITEQLNLAIENSAINLSLISKLKYFADSASIEIDSFTSGSIAAAYRKILWQNNNENNNDLFIKTYGLGNDTAGDVIVYCLNGYQVTVKTNRSSPEPSRTIQVKPTTVLTYENNQQINMIFRIHALQSINVGNDALFFVEPVYNCTIEGVL